MSRLFGRTAIAVKYVRDKSRGITEERNPAAWIRVPIRKSADLMAGRDCRYQRHDRVWPKHIQSLAFLPPAPPVYGIRWWGAETNTLQKLARLVRIGYDRATGRPT